MSYGNGGEWNAPTQTASGILGETILIEKGPPTNGVGRELDRHQKAGEALHQVIDQLVQRLESILTPVGPSAGSTNQAADKPAPSSSQIVSILRANGYRTEAAIQRLNEVMKRIEL